MTSATGQNSLAASASNVVNGLVNAVILIVGARSGQADEIAAYVVMHSAVAVIAITVGGGSSLLYISGDENQRRSVRSQWALTVMPGLVVGSILVSLFYSRRDYGWTALAAASITAIGNNLSIFRFGDLMREMRFVPAAVITCISRLSALALVVAGARLTSAFLAAIVVQTVLVEWTAWRTSWLRPAALRQLSLRRAVSASRMNRALYTYTLAELYSGRAATIALSLTTSPQVTGYFGAVVSLYEGLGRIFQTGLLAPMVAKVRSRHGISGHPHRPGRFVEVAAVSGALTLAACVLGTAPWITQNVLHVPLAISTEWLRILVIALPFSITNQAVSLHMIGEGHYSTATKIALLNASIFTVALAIAMPSLGLLGAAIPTLCAELLTAATLGVIFTARRPSASERGKP